MVTAKLMIMRRKNNANVQSSKLKVQSEAVSKFGAEVLAEAGEDEEAAADDEGQIENDLQGFGGVVVGTFGVFPEFYPTIRRFRAGKEAMQKIAPVIEEIVKEQGGGQQGDGDGEGKDHFFSGKQTAIKMFC
jgi:hypothetical protein